MSRHATYEDANLILRMYEIRREEKLRQAREWFSMEFKATSFEEAMQAYPPGSDGFVYIQMVTSYWDMVAGFIANDVLHEEMFFSNGYEMLGCWVRIRPSVPGLRNAFQNPLYLSNLEEVAARYAAYLDRHSPGAFAAFTAATQG